MQIPDKVMKRVFLQVRAGLEPGEYRLTPQPVPLVFIHGVGAAGLTPFEIVIQEMAVGEVRALHLGKEELTSFFGTFYPLVMQELTCLLPPENLHLEVTFVKACDADDRDIVKAMSSSLASCNCGCNCS